MSVNTLPRQGGTAIAAQSNFIDAAGVETHYLTCGDPSKPPIILIHGGGAGATAMGNWQGTFPLFTEAYYVIAPEMLGFGQTGKPDDSDYSQDARVEHMKAFLDAMGLSKVPLVGNSMGGATSLGICMKWPELVSDLVLMGSAGLNVEITPSMMPILGYDFTVEGMRKLIDALTGPLYSASDEIIQARYEGSIDPEARKAYTKTMDWIKAEGGLAYTEDAIAQVKTRTLVVNGKDDIVVPMAYGIRFMELLENSTGYFMPHIGHWVMIEAPEEFAEIVMGFLARGGDHGHA
jgi:2-hydroxy-6-oxo-6-(2'-aminophenyl)hexa-2,4-dienoate hydrolase|uniref:Meta-cleavage compound hydrolase n=1 Tax=Lysobacter sp. OC7 TaxID=513005 RepID=C1PHW8_9GAMM|nr:meta-cleavage compound hydrolase [Lysobacter sp. OC7]